MPSPKGSPFDLLQGRTDAIAKLQRELLRAGQPYLACARSVGSRSLVRLVTKLPTMRSVPEAMQAYQECISQRMQMAAEDGRRLSEDCQKIMQKITTSLTNGSPMHIS